MKVLIIASWYPTSDQPLNGIFFQQKARALARCGCDVTVAVADVRLRLNGRKTGITVSRKEGITEYYGLYRNLTPFWEEGIAIQQIFIINKIYKQICKNNGKPDVIHLESARCAYAAVNLAKKENIPLTYTEHYSGILNSKSGTFLDRTMKCAVNAADHVFFISTAMKNRLNPPVNKSSYLPNGVDFSKFHIEKPETQFTFGAMGGLRKIKGYDILLRAFSRVHELYPDCKLVIGGEGSEKENLLLLQKELYLNDCVHFCGKIDVNNKAAFFADKSAFICSSLTETFSIVLVEAFASGIPVVATKCGGPEDLVNDSNGYLVEKDNVLSLANGMIDMIKNREKFSSDKIRCDANEKYGDMSVAQNQVAKFELLISN